MGAAVIGASALLSGCGAGGRGPADAAGGARAGRVKADRVEAGGGAEGGGVARDRETAQLWYLVDSGGLHRRRRPPDSGTRPLRPWTTQHRIADMLPLGGRLFIAVNGLGVTSVTFEEAGRDRTRNEGRNDPSLNPPKRSELGFDHYHHPELFSNRTVTRIFPLDGGLLCHVYRNTVLNDSPTPVGGRRPNMVFLEPSRGSFTRIQSPFGERHGEWEMTDAERIDEYLFYLRWKLARTDTTAFHHTAFDMSTGRESEIQEELFRRSVRYLPPRPGGAADPVRALIRKVRGLYPEDSVLYGLLRCGEDGSVTRLLLDEGSAETPPGLPDGAAPPDRVVVTVRLYSAGRGCAEAGGAAGESDTSGSDTSGLAASSADGSGDPPPSLALLPDGRVFEARGRPAVLHYRLPALPAGFVYTDLCTAGGWLVAAWEERDFTHVGAAGLLLFDPPS